MKAWWLWNQLPVTLGNTVSGALFTGVALYMTYAVQPAPAIAKEIEMPARLEAVAP
jgi:formate/nitrite transporter FocA (FNT family)